MRNLGKRGGCHDAGHQRQECPSADGVRPSTPISRPDRRLAAGAEKTAVPPQAKCLEWRITQRHMAARAVTRRPLRLCARRQGHAV